MKFLLLLLLFLQSCLFQSFANQRYLRPFSILGRKGLWLRLQGSVLAAVSMTIEFVCSLFVANIVTSIILGRIKNISKKNLERRLIFTLNSAALGASTLFGIFWNGVQSSISRRLSTVLAGTVSRVLAAEKTFQTNSYYQSGIWWYQISKAALW